MAAKIYSLVYMSVASFSMTCQNLTDLLSRGHKYNSENGITGLLVYAGGNFMELLEGERNVIDDLMSQVTRDARHREVDVLQKGEVAERQFSDWSMAFLDFVSPEIRAMPGYSTFLERPLWSSEGAGQSSPQLDLLDYFKAVMTASEDAIKNLASKVGTNPQEAGVAGKISAARKSR